MAVYYGIMNVDVDDVMFNEKQKSAEHVFTKHSTTHYHISK